MNVGVEHVETPWMLHLNNDIEAIAPGWLDQMGGWLMQADVGVVGAKLCTGRIDSARGRACPSVAWHTGALFPQAGERRWRLSMAAAPDEERLRGDWRVPAHGYRVVRAAWRVR